MSRYKNPDLNNRLQPPAPKSFRVPAWMGEDGRKLWKQLSPILIKQGVITVLDKTAFEMLCSSYGILKRIENDLAGADPLVSDGRGGQKKNPLFTIHKQQVDQFSALAKDFGLTPVSRGRISVNPDLVEDDLMTFLETNHKVVKLK